MKQIIALIIAAFMSCSTVTATAAEAIPGSEVSEIPAPTGHISEIATPDGYTVDEAVLGAPLVAYTWDYLDDVATENGYANEEPEEGSFLIYTRDEDGYVTHVIISSDFATICVHSDPNMPGAIMVVECYADETVVYSTVDIVEVLFGAF